MKYFGQSIIIIFIVLQNIQCLARARLFSGQDDPICCLPDQWEAVVFMDTMPHDGPDPMPDDIVVPSQPYYMAYDAVGHKFHVNYEDTIFNNTENKLYMPSPGRSNVTLELNSVIDDELGSFLWSEYVCLPMGGTDINKKCLPGNATATNKFTVAKSNIVMETYNYFFPGTVAGLGRNYTVTYAPGCIPVEALIVITDPQDDFIEGFYNLVFQNFTSGIKDPHIFDIPKGCFGVS